MRADCGTTKFYSVAIDEYLHAVWMMHGGGWFDEKWFVCLAERFKIVVPRGLGVVFREERATNEIGLAGLQELKDEGLLISDLRHTKYVALAWEAAH